MGSILTLTIACQPKESHMRSSQNANTNENPAQSDNEDEDVDDGTYGDGDTSSSCSENLIQPVVKVESATDVADIKDVDPGATLSNTESVVEISDATKEEPSLGNVVVLEAVTPVEVAPEHQEEVSSSQGE